MSMPRTVHFGRVAEGAPSQLGKSQMNGNSPKSNGALSPLEVSAIEEAQSRPAEAHNPLEGLNLMSRAQSEAKLISRSLGLQGYDDRYGKLIVARGAAIRLQEALTRLIALEEQ